MTTAPKSLSISLLVAIMEIGCSSSPTEAPAAPPHSGELAVSVNVNGDPSTGPLAYGIALNGSGWVSVPPNQFVRRPVSPGSYELSLAPLSSWLTPSWCANVGTNRQSVSVMDGAVQSVAFAVICPPLVGSGLVRVTVLATGRAIPAEIPVLVNRLTTGPKYSRTINVPANDSVEASVSVGVLQITLFPGSTCKGQYASFIPIISVPPRVVLRDGSVARVRLNVTCG